MRKRRFWQRMCPPSCPVCPPFCEATLDFYARQIPLAIFFLVLPNPTQPNSPPLPGRGRTDGQSTRRAAVVNADRQLVCKKGGIRMGRGAGCQSELKWQKYDQFCGIRTVYLRAMLIVQV